MAKSKNSPKAEQAPRKRPPAKTVEGRENQMIALAVDLAEKQLVEGTASSQIVSHYLKLATTKARVELEIAEKQRDLIVAKTESLRSNEEIKELYTQAMSAFRQYAGQEEILDD